MQGKIKSGQLCTVEPIVDFSLLSVGDIVLCRVSGKDYLHLVTAKQDSRAQIGNNRGFINGWTGAGNVFGKCIKVED